MRGEDSGPFTPQVEASQDVSMLDHVSIQCGDVGASAAFYDAVLAPLGGRRLMDFGTVVGYGVPPNPDFWLGPRETGAGFRETHLAFSAADRATVRAFQAAYGLKVNGQADQDLMAALKTIPH